MKKKGELCMPENQRLLDFSLRTTEQFSSMAANFTAVGENIVKTLMDCIENSKVGKELKRDTLAAFYIDNFQKKEMLCAMLRKENIPFIVTKTKSGRDAILLGEKNIDRLFAMNRALDQSHEKGLISKDAVMFRGEGSISSYENLTYQQASLFLVKAEEKGIGINVQEATQDKYTLYFAKKDSAEIVKLSASVAYDLSGKTGDILKKQMDYYEKNTCKLAEKAAWEKTDSSFYLLGKNGDVALRNAVSFIYEKADGEKYFMQVAKHEKEINQIVCLMDRPTEMTEEQFSRYLKMDKDGRLSYITQLDAEQGCPQLSSQERQLLEKKEECRSLMEEKLLQLNPEQVYATKALSDDTVSTSSFIEASRDNWEQQHDMAQIGVDDPTLFDDARAMQNGFIITEEPFTGDTFYTDGYEEALSLDQHDYDKDISFDRMDQGFLDDYEIPEPELD